MPHNNLSPPAYINQPSVQQTQSPTRTTFADYKNNTAISHKRRDTETKKIDKLVEDHLTFPNNPNALHKLHVEAPKHLERLQRSSPMRHALVSSQLDQIVSRAAAQNAAPRAPAHHAPNARQQNRSAYVSQGGIPSGRNNVVIVGGSGSGSGGASGSGQGGGSGGSGGS